MIKNYKTRDRWILFSVLALSVLGIVMVASASIGIASVKGSKWAFMNTIKQIGFCFAGWLLMSLFSRTYTNAIINRNTWPVIYTAMIGALLYCLKWPAEKGTRAWIRTIPFFTIQPSEFTKIGIIIILAYLLVDMPKRYRLKHSSYYRSHLQYQEAVKERTKHCLKIPIFITAVLFVTVAFIQDDFGTGAITLLICITCFMVAQEKIYTRYQNWTILAAIALLVALPFLFKYVINGYMKGRFITWIDPLSDPTGASQQVANALIAITNGGIFGVGLGNSIQKFGYVPEVHNDFITSVILEEFGLIGLAMIVVPYAIIVFRLIKYAQESRDPKTTIILMGISSYFLLHLFINLGGVSGLIPMTGVPLLFVSSGGSSTLSAFCAIGIAQALISKDNKARTQLV